jgi:ADP-ribose pyrophosphatase YjhB (NUDIX family)
MILNIEDGENLKLNCAGVIVLRKYNNSYKVALIHDINKEGLGLPKGGREKGEKIIDTCIRELKEETGLLESDIILNKQKCVIEIKQKSGKPNIFYLVAIYEKNEEHTFTYDTKEIDLANWFEINKLKEDMKPISINKQKINVIKDAIKIIEEN